MIVAAVDCGTNTIKLLVADLDPATGAEIELVREARMVRLGQGVDRTGRLADEALRRVFAAVEEYADLVSAQDVAATRFCATSAVRDASNAAEFSDGVERRLGVLPEVLSGGEEAALSYAGATRALGTVHPPAAGPVLVVDIGGGSTELVIGDPGSAGPAGSQAGGAPTAGHSVDVGSVRLTERLLHSDPPTPDEVRATSEVVEAALDVLPSHGVRLEDARTVVAVSGTGLTVAAAALDLPSFSREALEGAVVATRNVHAAVERVLTMTVEQRRALPYMHPGRADVIGAGALILGSVLLRADVPELRVSVRDILDGIAWSVAVRGG